MVAGTGTKYRTADLKCQLDEHGNRIGKLETSDAVQNIHIDKLCDKVKKHDETIKALNDFSIKAGEAIGIGKWVMLAFGGSVIALIWSLITGQVTLQFP